MHEAQADEVGKVKLERCRFTYDEQVGSDKRKSDDSLIAASVKGKRERCGRYAALYRPLPIQPATAQLGPPPGCAPCEHPV